MVIKAVLFDFMGTCLDWHSSIVAALPSDIEEDERSRFALEWRQAYFDACTVRRRAGEPVEDIDVTHERTLGQLLASPKYSHLQDLFTEEVRRAVVEAWHAQPAWPDVFPALSALRRLRVRGAEEGKGLELFVHANGTTRLQLDLVRSSGLKGCYEMLFSSQMLGVYKPARESYEAVMGLLGVKAEDCVMVAAHNNDLRGMFGFFLMDFYV